LSSQHIRYVLSEISARLDIILTLSVSSNREFPDRGVEAKFCGHSRMIP